MLNAVKLFGVGIIIGIANIIPGVSGGTLAVVFNVYDRLLAVITFRVKKILALWKFWLPLGAGAAAGILFFAKLVSYLFRYHPVPTRGFFIGIIAGSIPLIFRRACGKGGKLPPLSAVIAALLAFALMVVMLVVKPEGGGAAGVDMTPGFFVFLAAAGALAALAMIIPGISGSFLLLALGVYQKIIGAVASAFDAVLLYLNGGFSDFFAFFSALSPAVLVLAPVALGIIIGLLAGAALVRFLLKKVPRQTYGAILGLIAGSILVVFPSERPADVITLIVTVLVFAGGITISAFFARNSEK
jgi:putative membrane protein